MYYILVYDIANAKILRKTLNICRKYLHWLQRSVFEGELGKVQFQMLISELKAVINKKEDSIVIFSIRNKEVFSKNNLGKSSDNTSNFF